MTSSITKDPIQGLIDYILDIKPYHSKIAEVIVDYSINDDVNVTILDQNVMDIVATEDFDSAFVCDEGFGVLPFGGPDSSIAYMPDLTIDGFITYPGVLIQLPILYIDPFIFAYYNIVGVNPSLSTWTISGNHASEFIVGQPFHVDENVGSGNGGYTIVSATNSGPNTDLVVNEVIPVGASANGTLSINVGSFFVQGEYGSVIVSASSVSNHFIIDTDQTTIFVPGRQFIVFDTASNNGTYTVLSSTYNIGLNQTTINVAAVPANQGAAGAVVIELADIITPGSNLTIQSSHANDGVWRVISATHETGQNNPPGFDPVSSLTEIRVSFVTAFHTYLPVDNVNSFSAPFQFDVAGIDFDQHYSVGDAVQIFNSTQSYNNSTWIISAITPIVGGFRFTGTHVLDPGTANLTISPVLNPLLILPVLSINTTSNLFFVSGNHIVDFLVGSFFNAVDLTNMNGNQGKWLVVSPAPVYDPINDLTHITATFNQIFSVVGTADGRVLVFTRSNWDLPELCKTASSTTTSSFIGETLEFIAGTEFVYNEILDVEICDLTASIGWGAGDGTEFLHILGGNQGLKEFFVAGDFTTRIGSSFAIVSANHISNTFVVTGDQTVLFSPGRVFSVGGTPANNGSYVVLTSVFNGVSTGITVSSIPVTQGAVGTIYTTLITVINSTAVPTNNRAYNVVSVTYNIGPNTTTITVNESIPSAFFDGTILFQPITSEPSFARTGWDDCGWDTQAALTLYQYRLSVAPPTDTFTSFTPDGGSTTPHGFIEGDVITVSGALPLPVPLVADTFYYVHVVSPTTFKLATSSANLAANIFITATTTGNLEYQFVEKESTWISYTSGKLNLTDPGSLLQTYANASFGESLTIAVTFGVDAGTVVGSWDYPYWDVGAYDEDVDALNSLYGSSF